MAISNWGESARACLELAPIANQGLMNLALLFVAYLARQTHNKKLSQNHNSLIFITNPLQTSSNKNSHSFGLWRPAKAEDCKYDGLELKSFQISLKNMESMIKFFRKIRQKLISEKKFSNYLIYAIGEIVLVVIGILIALAINNSNENRAIREKEQIYMIGLKNEFQTSKLKLKELIKVNKHNYEGAKKIVEFMSNETAPPSEKQFSELLFNTFSFDIAFNPNNSLLNEMINSGSLKDISNTELRMHLTNWISTIEDVAKQEIELGIQREKVLDIFRTNEYSIRTILDLTDVSSNEIGLPKGKNNISNLKLLNSKEFENDILMFFLTSHATESTHYNPLMEDLNFILELINAEIKK